MSQSEHTPGPWAWNRYEFRDGFYGLYSGDLPVLYPQRENDGDDGDAWFSSDEDYYGETALKEADARLIAAAPELLAALQQAVTSMQDHGWRNEHLAVRAARAAISKATGGA